MMKSYRKSSRIIMVQVGYALTVGAATILYDTEDLQYISELFEGFFDSYQIHDAGRTLLEELCENWRIFNPEVNAEQVLALITALCKEYFEEHYDLLSGKIILKKTFEFRLCS